MNELLKLSAFEIAQKISNKEVKPSEVLEVHIQHIEKTHSATNALVENNFKAARREALEKDQLQNSSTKLPPLFGVPFTVKEMIAVEGMKSTGGNIHHRDAVANFTATTVQRIKNAGAIVLGTTNVPELGFWFESNNVIYGRTNCAYDSSRIAGGSSGGEGAIIGVGGSPFGIGSDIGGSIRMPCFFNGISGHKPSRKTIPLTGHFPYSKNDFHEKLTGQFYPYTSIGPMARKASDLYPLMNIMLGSDDIDQETLKDFKLKNKIKDWSDKKVFILPDPRIHLASTVSSELMMAVHNAGAYFEQLGARVEKFPQQIFIKSVELWLNALKSTKTGTFGEALRGNDLEFSVTRELFKFGINKSNYTLPSLLTVALENIKNEKEARADLLEQLEILKIKFNDLMDDNSILILPPFPRVAPKHNTVLATPFDFIYSGIFNVLGVPATATPTGLNSEGLPLGVQIVAGLGNDHLTLSAAETLELAFGGWQPPEKFIS